MKVNLEKYYPWVKHITIALDVLFLFTLLISFAGYLPEFWNILYIFYFVLAINTGFLALKINKIPEEQRDNKSWIYLISHLFILILVIIAVNQFLKRDIITDYMPYIIGFAIASGFLTFFTHKDKVEKELEDEKEKEEGKEKRRKEEFDVKFKWLTKFNLPYGFSKVTHNKNDSLFNKILKLVILTIACPFIFLIRVPYSLTKWMYKEGWGYSVPFFIIIITFIVIRFLIPLFITTSYIDEYFHIFSGLSFIKSGHFAIIYNNFLSYSRSSYVSLFLSGLFFIFGKSLYIAKLLPISIGIINFIIFYKLSRTLIPKKNISLLLLLYTFSPYILFNDFYIRMYIFYEFYILLTIYLYCLIIKYIHQNKIVKPIICLTLSFCLIFIELFFNQDIFIYLLVLVNSIFIVYIFIFEVGYLSVKNRFFKWIMDLPSWIKISLLLFLFILISIKFLSLDKLINSLLYGTLKYTSLPEYKYYNLFFNVNIFISIFFIIGAILAILKGGTKGIISFIFLSLFIIHISSSLDLQITRAVLYFFPVYYLFSLELLSFRKKGDYIKILIIAFIIFSLINSYPSDFFGNGPHLEGEITNINYQSAYTYVSINCDNKIVYGLLHHPYISLFYNTRIDYVNYIQKDKLVSDEIYSSSNDNLYKTVLGSIPVISDENLIKTIMMNNTSSCIIIRSEREHNGLYITQEEENTLKRNFSVHHFNQIDVYTYPITT